MFDVWLRRKMSAAGDTRAKLARAIEADESTITRWLDEGRLPERKYVIRLSLHYRVSPESILKVTDPQEFTEALEFVERNDITAVEALNPEIRAFHEEFSRLPPGRKAAILLLMRSESEGAVAEE